MAKWEFYGALGSTADNERIASPHDKVADEVKFNPKFGDRHIGHWYGKSHHFHMSTPKYFVRNDWARACVKSEFICVSLFVYFCADEFLSDYLL